LDRVKLKQSQVESKVVAFLGIRAFLDGICSARSLDAAKFMACISRGRVGGRMLSVPQRCRHFSNQERSPCAQSFQPPFQRIQMPQKKLSETNSKKYY